MYYSNFAIARSIKQGLSSIFPVQTSLSVNSDFRFDYEHDFSCSFWTRNVDHEIFNNSCNEQEEDHETSIDPATTFANLCE